MAAAPIPKAQPADVTGPSADSSGSSRSWERAVYAAYGLALLASVALWFLAFRSPLWLDETGSWWLIQEGFWKIAGRQGDLSFPAYSYILWAFTKIFGTTEIALRIPSVLAMLAAVYFLYRAAAELFSREVTGKIIPSNDVALLTAILFAIHPIAIYAAIDVRPYAFAALAINLAIFLLVRLRTRPSLALAALFGIDCAFILYFHYLFGVILPALLFCLIALGAPRLALFETWENNTNVRKTPLAKTSWEFVAVALAAFALAFLPVIPGLLAMFRTRASHVFETAPQLRDLGWTFFPGYTFYILVGALLLAAALRRFDLEQRINRWNLLVCASLGIVPILILYGVSAATPLHMFTERHRLVAIPGIALCWGFVASRLNSRWLRLVFCAVVVGFTVNSYLHFPNVDHHGYSWKYALAAADKNAAPDQAPLLICSDLPESDYEPMPGDFLENTKANSPDSAPEDVPGDAKDALASVRDTAKNSRLFIQLSYYQVHAPVIGLPRTLNTETRRVTRKFLATAAPRHQRFLALAFGPSWDTLRYLISTTAGTYDARVLGQYDGVAVVEFLPRTQSGL